jgi:hypothetical protein
MAGSKASDTTPCCRPKPVCYQRRRPCRRRRAGDRSKLLQHAQ